MGRQTYPRGRGRCIGFAGWSPFRQGRSRSKSNTTGAKVGVEHVRKICTRLRFKFRKRFVLQGQPAFLSEALLEEQQADEKRRDCATYVSGPRIDLRFYFDQYWVDDRSVFIRGFLFVVGERVMLLDFASGPCGPCPTSAARHSRPDLSVSYGIPIETDDAGFSALFPFRPGAPILMAVTTVQGTTRFSIVLAGRSKVSTRYKEESAYLRLIKLANRPGARILEIGSRVVGSLSTQRASNFPLAAQFVGVDIHPGPGVDLVCDAHSLASAFRPGSFDVVFSLSVLEHLPAPWRIAQQINQVLALDGIVMKSVPFCFPLHETPNDFWRFSDKGLEQLFGPAFGFAVIASGLECEMRIIPEWREILTDLPLNPGYSEAWIFAKKVAECVDSSGSESGWSTQRSLQYPGHQQR